MGFIQSYYVKIHSTEVELGNTQRFIIRQDDVHLLHLFHSSFVKLTRYVLRCQASYTQSRCHKETVILVLPVFQERYRSNYQIGLVIWIFPTVPINEIEYLQSLSKSHVICHQTATCLALIQMLQPCHSFFLMRL